MLEIFLHKNNLINPGAIIKHDWFSSSRKANEKLSFDFKNKEKIINLLVDIEAKRNILCYGKPQPVETISSVIESYNKIKSILRE